jgi:hypothetical protein
MPLQNPVSPVRSFAPIFDITSNSLWCHLRVREKFVPFSCILKMETAAFAETLVTTYQNK